MQMKLEVAGGQVRTAREFIDRLGSVSSLTGIATACGFLTATRSPAREFLRTEA